MKMEPIEGYETSAFKTQTPGKYPKENILQHSLYFPHIRSGKKTDQLISFKKHHEQEEHRQLLYCILYKAIFQTVYSNSTQFSVNASKLERKHFFFRLLLPTHSEQNICKMASQFMMMKMTMII